MDTTINYNINGGGVSIQTTIKKSADGNVSGSPALAAGKAGTLSTRTSNTVGVATLGASHGITTGMKVDVYWTGGVRYGVIVGTVSGTSVPLTDSGAGDNYPVQSTAIIVSPVTTINAGFDADNAEAYAFQCAKRGHIAFYDAGDAELDAAELLAAQPYMFVSGAGLANPLTGNAVAKIVASTADLAASTLKYVVSVDNTD